MELTSLRTKCVLQPFITIRYNDKVFNRVIYLSLLAELNLKICVNSRRILI